MNGILVTSEKSKKLTKIYVLLLLLDIIAVCGIYFSTGQMEGQNRACSLWVKIRMVHYLVEVLSLYGIFKEVGYFDKEQKNEEEQLLSIKKNRAELAGRRDSEIDFKVED